MPGWMIHILYGEFAASLRSHATPQSGQSGSQIHLVDWVSLFKLYTRTDGYHSMETTQLLSHLRLIL